VTAANAPRWLAEFVGTALLVGIGTGAIVAVASRGGIPLWQMALVWVGAVLVPVVLVVRVSGAHLNPAVTLALAVSGRIAWRELPPYVVSQCAGAFLGSVVVSVAIGRSAELGATVPHTTNLPLVFAGEWGFTALLIATVFVLSDRGEGSGRWRLLLPPLAVGSSTFVIGPISGSSLNPARSLAPAVLSGTYTDLWVYLVATVAAAIVVALLWKPRSVDRLDRGPGRPAVTQ
jgi:MIP family channel proteins